MIYGYARVSTKKQKIDRQIENIKNYDKNAIIISEHFTGTKIDRPEWNKLYRILKPNDVVIFDEVSRMSRNADEGFSLYKELFEKGVELVFIKEPHINTDIYRNALKKRIDVSISTGRKSTDKLMENIIEALNNYLLDVVKEQIRLAFEQAQKEVDYLRLRTKEGLAKARMNGQKLGNEVGITITTKKSLECKSQIIKYSKSFEGTLNDRECIKLIGISKNTFYKYKKALKSDI